MTKHILIIGGGVIGLSTALYCARRGHKVTVVEREAPEEGGCTLGNAGMIVPSHFVPLAAPGMVGLALRWMWNPESPFYLRPRLDLGLFDWAWKFWRAANAAHVTRSASLLRDLSLASRACFEELETAGHDFGLVKKGLLMLCKDPHVLAEEAAGAQRARELGIPAEVLSPRLTAALEPNVQMDIAGSVYYPKDCHLVPHRFMEALRAFAQKAGAVLCSRRAVTGWRVAGAHVQAALVGNEELAADEFVICGGAWSPGTARGLDLKLPMQAGKGYSLTLPQPCQLPEICCILTEARVAVTPMAGALRVGGTMEIAGLDRGINPARVRGIVNALPRYLPAFRAEDFTGLPVWCGLRPCSPDGLPYVGRTARHSNLSVAAGHAMLGLSLAPITGQLMSEILSGAKPSLDVRLLSPDRYR